MKEKQRLSDTSATVIKPIIVVLLIVIPLFTSSTLFAQVKIGSNPTVIDPANNLEVESTDPAKKISINKTTGKLPLRMALKEFQNINFDANGVATWQTQSSLAIPVTVFNGAIMGSAIIPAFTQPHDQIDQRLPLSPIIGASGWNATTKRYTVSSNGSYSVQVAYHAIAPQVQGLPYGQEYGLSLKTGAHCIKA